jgi:hypothetical protein
MMPRRCFPVFLILVVLLVASNLITEPLPIPTAYSAGPVGAPSFGLNTHLATRYPDPTSMDIPAELVSDLGVPWVREDFHWHRVQPAPDVWDWTFTDAAMRALLRRDIEVLGVLGPSVGWATANPDDTPNDVSFYAPDPDLFEEYVRAVVTRYRRYIHHWEIWNEPDNSLFWQPQPDPQAYAELLMRASAVIKEIDPQAQVLIGGFNPFDVTFARAVAAEGAWDSFDIIAIHPYVDPYSPEDGNIAASAGMARALGNQFGPKPIWVTELGWSSGPGDRDREGLTDEEQQANYLVRAMLLLWEAGVERSFWYMLKDDSHNPYGLIRAGRGREDYRQSQQKPAYAALRTLNRELAGASFVERQDLFEKTTIFDFEQLGEWRRVSQPNGRLEFSSVETHAGVGSAQIVYNFSTDSNDYVVFERPQPIPLAGEPYALGVWVYGDGSGHGVRAWLRDAEGEVLQFALGSVGAPEWHFISTPIGVEVDPGNRITGSGNGRVDFPASLVALVLDDVTDESRGRGTVYLDNLTVVSGREVYDMRLRRGDAALDILWSPPTTRVGFSTTATTGQLVERDGVVSDIGAIEGRFSLTIGPAPVYLWHTRE